MHESIKGGIAELVGTFALTFVSAAALCTDSYSGGGTGLLGIAMASGLILAATMAALGRVSGAHVNPAVTAGALLTGAIAPRRAFVWLVAQLTGASIAGLMLKSVFAADVWEPVELGAPMLGPGVQPGTAIFIEAALAFLLVLAYLGTWNQEERSHLGSAFAVGATLAAAILVGGPLTGAALNPARAFGPQLAAGYWQSWHVYWIGPALGAVLAAVVHGLSGAWWPWRDEPPIAAPQGEEP